MLSEYKAFAFQAPYRFWMDHMDHMGSHKSQLGAKENVPDELSKNHDPISTRENPSRIDDDNIVKHILDPLDLPEENFNLENDEPSTLRASKEVGSAGNRKKHHDLKNVINEVKDALGDIDFTQLTGKTKLKKRHDSKDDADIQDILDAIDRIDSSDERTGSGEWVLSVPKNAAPGNPGVTGGNDCIVPEIERNYGSQPPPLDHTQPPNSTPIPYINPWSRSSQKRKTRRFLGGNGTLMPNDRHGNQKNLQKNNPWNGAPGQQGVIDGNYDIQPPPPHGTQPPYNTRPPHSTKMPYINPIKRSPQRRERRRISGGNGALMLSDRYGNPENTPNTNPWNGAPGQLGEMEGNYGIQPPPPDGTLPPYDTQQPYSTPTPYINPTNRTPHKQEPQKLSGGNGASMPTDRNGYPENIPNPFPWNGAPGQLGVMDGNYGIQPPPPDGTLPPYGTPMTFNNPWNSSPQKRQTQWLSGGNGALVPARNYGNLENIPIDYPRNGSPGHQGVMDGNYGIKSPPPYDTQPPYAIQQSHSTPMPYINPTNRSPQKRQPQRLSGGNGAVMPTDIHGYPENIPNTYPWNGAPGQLGEMDGNYGIQPPPPDATPPPYGTPMTYTNPWSNSPQERQPQRLSGGNSAVMPTDRHGYPENIPNTYPWNGAPGQLGVMDGNYGIQPPPPDATPPPYGTPMTYTNPWSNSPQERQPQRLSGGNSAAMPTDRHGYPGNIPNTYPWKGAPGQLEVMDGNYGIQPPPPDATPPPYGTPMTYTNPWSNSPQERQPQRLSGGNSAAMPTDRHGYPENIPNTYPWKGAPGQLGVMDGNYGIQPLPHDATLPPYGTPMTYTNPWNNSPQKRQTQWLSGGNGALPPARNNGNLESMEIVYPRKGSPEHLGVMDGNNAIHPQPPYTTLMPYTNPMNISPQKLKNHWRPMGMFGGLTNFNPLGKHRFEYGNGDFKTPPPYVAIPSNSTPLPLTDPSRGVLHTRHFQWSKNSVFDSFKNGLMPPPKSDNLENWPNSNLKNGKQDVVGIFNKNGRPNSNYTPPILHDRFSDMPQLPKGTDNSGGLSPFGDLSFGANGKHAPEKLQVWNGIGGFNPLSKFRGIFRKYVSSAGNHDFQYGTHITDGSSNNQKGNFMPFDDFQSMEQGGFGNTSPFHRFDSNGGFSPSSDKNVNYSFGTSNLMDPATNLKFNDKMPDINMEGSLGFDDQMPNISMEGNNGFGINEPTLDANMEDGPDSRASSINLHSVSFSEKSSVKNPTS